MTRMRGACMVVLLVAASSAARSATPKFFPDDPIWVEPITQDVKNATRYEPDLIFQSLENLFTHPGDKVLDQRAKNLNTVDEVPDGAFYVNPDAKVGVHQGRTRGDRRAGGVDETDFRVFPSY